MHRRHDAGLRAAQAPRPPARTRFWLIQALGCLLVVCDFIAGKAALALNIKRLGGSVKVVAGARTDALVQACTP